MKNIITVFFAFTALLHAQDNLRPIDSGKREIDPIKNEEIDEKKRVQIQKKRLKKLMDQAEDDNLKACLELGNCYYFGRLGLEKDLEKAAFWWQKSAARRDRQSMFNLANLYVRGSGVEKSLEKAVSLYAGAADLGLPQANINAAQVYDRLAQQGEKTISLKENASVREVMRKNIDHYRFRARKYYREASALKDFHAMRRYAEYCEYGLGGVKNMKLAVDLFLQCAQSGDAYSQFKMAYFCQDSSLREVYNPNEALRWIMLSADNGNLEAQAQVGYLFQQGIGVSRDYQVAFRWFKLSADRGFAPAQVAVGNCYVSGSGVSQDLKEAFKWYQKAALSNYPMALYNVGVCYMSGRGVEKNKEMGLSYYRKAAELKLPQALFVLGTMNLEGEEIPRNLAQGILMLQEAAVQKHPSALYRLGRCYLEGTYLKKNREQAKRLLMEASDLGSQEAFEVLVKNFKKGEY